MHNNGQNCYHFLYNDCLNESYNHLMHCFLKKMDEDNDITNDLDFQEVIKKIDNAKK